MNDTTSAEPTLNTKKKEIRTVANSLSYDDRIYILDILRHQISPSKIIENADGSRINLDMVSVDIIDKIYRIMKTRSKISQTNRI